jgi:hypothetical protein
MPPFSGHFLDEKRYAADACGHVVNHLARQSMAGRQLRYHDAYLRAIERRQRAGRVMRAHIPTRSELRPGRRDDEQRRPVRAGDVQSARSLS